MTVPGTHRYSNESCWLRFCLALNGVGWTRSLEESAKVSPWIDARQAPPVGSAVGHALSDKRDHVFAQALLGSGGMKISVIILVFARMPMACGTCRNTVARFEAFALPPYFC